MRYQPRWHGSQVETSAFFIKGFTKNPLFFILWLMGKEEIKLKEYSFEGSGDEKFYRKEDVDKLLAEKDKEIRQLEYLIHITSKQR